MMKDIRLESWKAALYKKRVPEGLYKIQCIASEFVGFPSHCVGSCGIYYVRFSRTCRSPITSEKTRHDA